MFRVLIFAILSLLPVAIRAQDSLYIAYYKITETDTVSIRKKALLLENIIERELHNSQSDALDKMDTLASFYKILGDSAMYNWARYHYKGFFYATHDDQLKALEYYQKHAKVFKRSSEKDGYFLIDVGNLYYSLKLFGLARKYYEEAEVVFKKINQYRGLTTVYGNYSLVAKNLGDIDSAFYYIQKTLDIQKRFVRDTFQIAHTYQVIGRLYSEKKNDFAAAISNFKEAVAILTAQPKEHLRYPQFIHILPYSLSRIAKSYQSLGKIDSAFMYTEKAISTARQIEQTVSLGLALVEAGYIYTEEKQYDKAMLLLQEAEALIEAHNVHTLKSKLYIGLREVYHAKKDYENEARCWEKINAIKDSVQSKDDAFLLLNDQILQQERNNTIAEQEKVITAEKNLRARLFIILVLIGLVLMLTLVFWWQLQRKNKLVTRYSKDLESSNTIKELMLMVIGHDMRSLFNSILGNSNQLISNLQNKELSRLERNTEQINIAAKKAYTTMDGLMQWVMLQKEDHRPNIKTCFLNDILDETVQQLSPLLQSAGLRIDSHLNNISIVTDPQFFQIILRNLLTNAIKHSPPHSGIVVHAIDKEGQLCLRVEDNGQGLSAEAMEALKQKKDAAEIARKGGGLGLEIVKQLCNDLQIQLQFFNKKPNGAVFELYLPKGEYLQIANANRIKNEDKKLALSADDLLLLRPYIAQLSQLEFFEGTAIYRILAEIGKLQISATAQAWVLALRQILAANDADAYKAQLASFFVER